MDGLLCALSRALRAGGSATIAEFTRDSEGLLLSPEEGERVVPDPAEAEAFLENVRQRLGPRWVQRVLRLGCAADPARDGLLRELYALAWTRGPEVEHWHAHPAVRAALRLERRVSLETHRFRGLLRFRRLATGRLWGPMEPDHDVTPLVAPFFRQRFDSERWLIHDVRRGYGIGGDPPAGECRLWTAAEIEAELAAGLDVSEQAWQALWRTFYRSIAITARRSPAVQRRCMPVRYWRHLIEEPGGTPRTGARLPNRRSIPPPRP